MRPAQPAAPPPARTSKVIFFDLDNTLFDQSHAIRCAVGAIQKECGSLSEDKLNNLVGHWNSAARQVLKENTDKKFRLSEKEPRRFQLFFESLAVPEPTKKEADWLRAKYRSVFQENRRPSPGSVQTLVRLREHGYRIGIISNGHEKDQEEKIQAIGIRHLIDEVITSEKAEHRKPDSRIFQYAVRKMNAPLKTTHMVGDSVDDDINAAMGAHLSPMLYSPTSLVSQSLLFGQKTPVIRRMTELLDHLGIRVRQFQPQFVSKPGQVVIEGLGIDVVTEPLRQFHLAKPVTRSLVRHMGMVLEHISEGEYMSAVDKLDHMRRPSMARQRRLVEMLCR